MKSGATSLRVSEKDNGLIVSSDIRNEVANEVISDRKKEKKILRDKLRIFSFSFFSS